MRGEVNSNGDQTGARRIEFRVCDERRASRAAPTMRNEFGAVGAGAARRRRKVKWPAERKTEGIKKNGRPRTVRRTPVLGKKPP